MLYKRGRFTVPATNQGGSCAEGHCGPDAKGRCIRCGAQAWPKPEPPPQPDEVREDGTRVYRSGNHVRLEREFHVREGVQTYGRRGA